MYRSLINFHIDQPGQPFTSYWKKCIAAKRAVNGLAGRHKITEHTFDCAHGSAFDTWLSFSAPAYPTSEELEWLQKRCLPEMKVSTIEITDSLPGEVTFPPHGVTMIEFLKLYLKQALV